MNVSLVSLLLGLGIMSISCRQREYNAANTKSMNENQQNTEQLGSLAFNAFEVWKNGEAERVEYPTGYDLKNPKNGLPDGTFYVDRAEFWKTSDDPTDGSSRFLGALTQGIRKNKADAVLLYPKNAKKMELHLKFTKASPDRMTHAEALGYCQKMTLRLPTARELFDFCSDAMEPVTCQDEELWSLSLRSGKDDRYGTMYSNEAWFFNGVSNRLDLISRVSQKLNVRCVGSL